ncbi:hypothetical protein [Okeania sp. SIO2B3]|uniref:hypothetical protein n=1 Tax=Okeania sp. SIO2B3 TaxID=2607784 RepID=UPI0013BFFA48|nr:hypothetical protein [Okeania sp. SIO2B3]NET46731.1 hypothetical protein [Okeania sp. SIO2B3]
MIPVSLVNHQQFFGHSSKSSDPRQYALYQILIVTEEEIKEANSTSPNLGLKTRVFTGTQEELKKEIKEAYKVNGLGELDKQIEDLPNDGLNMDDVMPLPSQIEIQNTSQTDIQNISQIKIKIDNKSEYERDMSLFINQYSTVRRLLQGRKLSQLIASTWLEDDNQQEDSIITKGCKDHVKKLLLRGNRGPDEPKAQDFDRKDYRDQMIIAPDQANWQNISLNLLFCGQAYFFKGKKFERLCEPLLSTYEASQLYAFEVVWNNFAAILEEKSQSGIVNPRGPYYTVSLPYPPCPNIVNDSEVGLTENMIEKWVTAQDVGPDEELPFVNQEWSVEKGINIKFVTPPYPYLPQSSCC